MSTEIPEPAPQAPAEEQSGPRAADPDGRAAADQTGEADPAEPGGAPGGGPDQAEAWQVRAAAEPASAGLPGLLVGAAMDVVALLSTAAISVLLSVPVAWIWVQLAPAVQGVVIPGNLDYAAPESEGPIGQDVTLGIICLVVGLLAAAAAFLVFRRKGTVGAVLGLAGGGLGGGYLAAELAGWFGPGHGRSLQQMIVGLPADKVIDLPLHLRATGVLWFWPVAAIALYLLLVVLFGPVEPQPADPQAWPDPAGQEWPRPGRYAGPPVAYHPPGTAPEAGPQPPQAPEPGQGADDRPQPPGASAPASAS
ncbi:MAG TPA: hypothetical protein VGX23_17155 [Actinocrinis sp.]|nr:hypothetical protein [Actinocrinis sp.]